MRVSQKNENGVREKNCQSPSSYRAQTSDSLKKSFPKSARILKHKHYVDLAKNCCRFVGNFVFIDYRLGSVSQPKLGITISKRQGKAHRRNTFKRHVREAFRLHQKSFASALELNVHLRKAVLVPTVNAIATDFLQFTAEISEDFHGKTQ